MSCRIKIAWNRRVPTPCSNQQLISKCFNSVRVDKCAELFGIGSRQPEASSWQDLEIHESSSLWNSYIHTHTHPVVLLLCLLLPPLHSRKSADSVFPVVRDGGMQLFLLCTGTTVERLRTTYRHSMETHGGKNTKRSSSKWMVKF